MEVATFTHAKIDARFWEIVQILKNGGLVVYPTDTVYGLACDATNQKAVNKLRVFKGQRGNKPISIAVQDLVMAEEFVELNDTARHLYQVFLPGPLTIISRIKDERLEMKDLAIGITSQEGTVGIRIIPHDFLNQLFNHIDFPITATSANISNAPNPRSLTQWLKNTPQKKQALVDLFIDAGELPYAQASTVIDTSKESTGIVRSGSLDLSSFIPHQSSNIQTFTSRSPHETKQIARNILTSNLSSVISHQSSPILLALQGPLGAGKTVFTQGIAQTLGISEPIRSPTYTLVKEYLIPNLRSKIQDQRSKLFHIDAWRLSNPDEFQDLGLDAMLKPGNIIVIEWPQRVNSLLSDLDKKILLATITITIKPKYRVLQLITS